LSLRALQGRSNLLINEEKIAMRKKIASSG
jgi:hypothetical protein